MQDFMSQNMFHPRLYFVCLSSVSGSSRFLFNHWYCMIAGFILVIMVLAVCVTHWKARAKEKKKKIRHPDHMLTSPVNIWQIVVILQLRHQLHFHSWQFMPAITWIHVLMLHLYIYNLCVYVWVFILCIKCRFFVFLPLLIYGILLLGC